MSNLYAVIPSCCRPQELRDLVMTLAQDGVQVVIVDTGYDRLQIAHEQVRVVQDHRRPKNIQRWWNVGLRAVYDTQMLSSDEFYVAVLNDDLVIPPGFVQTLVAAIERTDAAAASPCPGLRTPDMKIQGLETPYRMLGYAFVLRGSVGLHADERFGWWYGDNDLDWQARTIPGRYTGMTLVGGAWDGFKHLYPDSTTVGELAEQAGRDRQTFIHKWGRAPW